MIKTTALIISRFFRSPRRRFTFVFVIFLVLSTWIYYNFNNYNNSSSSTVAQNEELVPTWRNVRSSNTSINKLILFWTESWSGKNSPVKGWDINVEDLTNCSHKCDVTTDRDLLPISDALVYHGTTYSWKAHLMRNYLDYFPRRSSKNWDQVWIFVLVESLANDHDDLSQFNNVFNWTATYRLDSDLPYRYGRFENLTTENLQNVDNILNLVKANASRRSKTPVGWMSSRCQSSSNRELFVSKLSKFLPISTYGTCSAASERLQCGTAHECYSKMAENHKFWLTLENSICPDYLTEKFYRALSVGMIPVVYAHQSFVSTVPQGSYLNIADFKNVESLAERILELDSNSTEYLKYFEWRQRLAVIPGLDSKLWCNLCRKLYEDSDKRKTYVNLNDWWYQNNTGKPICI